MLTKVPVIYWVRQDSVAGSVNQATGLPDFEDVLRTGALVGQDFQPACVRTNPRGGVAGPKLLAEGPKNPKPAVGSVPVQERWTKVLPLPCSAQSLVLIYYRGCVVRIELA